MTIPRNLEFIPLLNKLDDEYPQMVELAVKIANETDGTVKVFVCDRDEFSDLDWTVNVTSPQGRRTFELIQRVAGGSIIVRQHAASGLVVSD